MRMSLDRRHITIGYIISLGALVASLICFPAYFVMSYDPSRTAEEVRIGPLFKVATFALVFALWNLSVFRAARRRDDLKPRWRTLLLSELAVALGLAFSGYVGHRFQAPTGFLVFVVVVLPVMILSHQAILRGSAPNTTPRDQPISRQNFWRTTIFFVLVIITVMLGLLLMSDVATLVTELIAR
jgi:uncharacterized membrane protein YfcA